jgi:hypothetical protein
LEFFSRSHFLSTRSLMGPSRTNASSSKRPSKHKKNESTTSSMLEKSPGVSKLKAQLRQTRRLLAKVSPSPKRMSAFPVPTLQDDLAADVRVETERRLKSLQNDLEKAEVANKEKALAVRYHKVKFFGQFTSDLITHDDLKRPIETERQKLIRKISQVKKQTPVDEGQLFALRVDLNYVLVRDKRTCSAGMRMLMLLPALPKTTEICSAISTVYGWGRRTNRNGSCEGRSEGFHPGPNGERRDCERTGGRMREGEDESMTGCREFRIRFTLPVPSAFGLLHFPCFFYFHSLPLSLSPSVLSPK